MKNLVLIVIDMQNAYFNNEALAACKQQLLQNANRLLDVAHEKQIPILSVRTEHNPNRSTWTLNMHDDDEGYLFAGNEDAQVVGSLRLTNAQEIVKTRDSAFFQTPLAEILKAQGTKTIVLLGVSTHGCILQTAADAYAHNFRVLLASDAIATHDPRFHESTLELLKQEYRQKALANGELIRYIQAVSNQ